MFNVILSLALTDLLNVACYCLCRVLLTVSLSGSKKGGGDTSAQPAVMVASVGAVGVVPEWVTAADSVYRAVCRHVFVSLEVSIRDRGSVGVIGFGRGLGKVWCKWQSI